MKNTYKLKNKIQLRVESYGIYCENKDGIIASMTLSEVFNMLTPKQLLLLLARKVKGKVTEECLNLDLLEQAMENLK